MRRARAERSRHRYLILAELPLFAILARVQQSDIASADCYLLENVHSIRRWMFAAQSQVEHGGRSIDRAGRHLKRTRAEVVRAGRRGDGAAISAALAVLPPKFWNQLRSAIRDGGFDPMSHVPVDLDVLADCIEIALSETPANLQQRHVHAELLQIREQIAHFARIHPLDFFDHWIALGSMLTSKLEEIARRDDRKLWRDFDWFTDELLAAIDFAIKAECGQRGHPRDEDRRHLFKVLAMTYVKLTGKAPGINADMNTRAAVFVRDVLATQPAPTSECKPVLFSKALLQEAFREFRWARAA